MKSIVHSLLFVCLMLSGFCTLAQVTNISTNLTGSTSTSSNSFVTFVVANNSGSGIHLKEVGSYSMTSMNGLTAELWYSSTSLSGTVSLTSPTWTQITSGTISGITSTSISTWLSGMTFLIPSGTSYRFALKINGTSVRYASSGTNNFTAAGVTLYIGNHQISGSNVGYVNTLSPRYFAGFIEFEPAGPPCTAPTGLNASNITSTSATLGWNGVSGSLGYEYDFSTTATPPATGSATNISNTSLNVTNLTPSTTYYLHVRNKCAPPQQAVSSWSSYQFDTNPPCTPRSISIKDITTNSADITWNAEGHASEYEYAISTQNTFPPTATMSSLANTYNAKSLAEGTKYYVYVRMHCPGGEMSDWALDSFVTRTICRPPLPKVDHIEANRAIVYWDHMPTAIAYEYEISQSPTPLGEGTLIKKNSFYAFPIKDGETYYFHVKSVCVDQGFESESEWTSTAFTTFPTSVANTGKQDFRVTVFPNPLQNALTLDISGKDISADAHVTITDMSGRTVYHKNITQYKTSIDLQQLTSGIYMMRYTDKDYSEVIKLTKK